MRRFGRWAVVCLMSALVPLGAQEPPPDDAAMMEPGMEPGSGLDGQPQQNQKVRNVFVAPFINDGGAELAFWSEGLTVIFADAAEARFAVTRVDTNPPLHADFFTGKLRATNDGDLRQALDRAGGDTLLVTRYSGTPDKFKISGEAFEGAVAGEPFAKVEISGQSPYVATRQYLEAWVPKLGAPAPAAGGEGPMPGEGGEVTSQMEPGMEGAPPAGAPAGGGSAAMPPAGAPPMADEGMMMEGMEGGMAAPVATVKVVDYRVEDYCRGMAAWPMLDPGYTWLGKIDEASDLFEQQLVADPNFGLGYTAAALTQVALGHDRRGIEIQRAWTSALDPAGAADYHNLARVFEAAGQPDDALTTYRQAIDAEDGPLPSDVVAVGRLEIAAGRPEKAIEAVNAGLEKLPRQRSLRMALGQAQLAAGNIKGAVEAYTTAVQMDPKGLDGYLSLADTYLVQRYGAKAVEIAKLATTQVPQAPKAWAKLAEAHLSNGRLPQALEAAQEAVNRAGNEAGPYQSLGEVQLAAGQYEPAAASFREAVQRDPAWNKPRRYLARTMLYAGQVDQAGALLQVALQGATVADMPATARDAARVAFYGGDYPNAMTMLQIAEDFVPQQPETQLLRSLVRLYLGDQEGAWADFAACLDALDSTQISEALGVLDNAGNGPELAASHAMAGYLYERIGNVDKAREHYRKYRVAAPKGYLIDLVKQRLDATEKRP